ncbi:hypothetical protein [Dactylosporangium sp. CA-092794]|uniref:hypothetical protein n=1 Tax=Dactylosporangium sp. CA-092794 TaxID=3239929 RepID=UPI003D93B756
MNEIEALLDEGAVLPVGTDAVKDTVDTLTTRAYTHPVLGERRVVRLVPGTLGAAEDLTMEFLGFAAPETVAEIGVVRQQALGFPAWALVHDPANGHHALALVKDVERLVRQAKSRIGPARDGFTELGDRLARAVPHFLPTFYEEAGRAFLAAESPTYAASMFGRAREAERLYALEIDEERQHTVFLEFALAGALTAKALAAHARDLAGRCPPAVAYERFRRLCVERTLGGLPPYAQMHVDLGRLAKAAGLGIDEEEALLGELLAAPSILRAPGGFWKAYRPALARLAGRDPRVRGQLLGMFPADCPFETWLDMLDECGATAALTEPAGAVDPAAEPADGPAGWLARADRSRGRRWRVSRSARFYALVERMAPRLRADGVAAELCPPYRPCDLDLVDHALALGIPLAEVSEDVRVEVANWITDEGEGRRDLALVAAHEGLVPLIAGSVEQYLKTWYRAAQAAVAPDRVERVVAVPGLRAALHWWLDRLAEHVAGLGLTNVGEELDRLTLVACPAGLAVNPAAIARITAFDLGPLLGRTLRGGVVDEFGWPALEAGLAAVHGDARRSGEHLQLQAQWPALMLRRGDRVAVVGDERVELEHTLRIPPEELRQSWHTAVRYADGQLLVSWNRGDERAAYWSGTPDDVFTTGEDLIDEAGQGSLALPDGGRTAGGRPLHAGDRGAKEAGEVISDGRHYWVQVQDADYNRFWHEFDPATGARGRRSVPAFFEEGAVDGQPLQLASCRLRPASPRMAQSPLGHRDGLVGWRVRTVPGGQAGESVDGRSFTLALPDTLRRNAEGLLAGAIRFPGSDTLHGLIAEHGWRQVMLHLCTADGLRLATVHLAGDDNPFAEGTALVPPAAFWHQLRPRDEAGSRALRALGDDAAARLLAAVSAIAGPEADRADFDNEAVRAAVRAEVPRLSDPALVAGVAGVVKHATRAALRLARLTGATESIAAGAGAGAGTGADTADAHLPGDELLGKALSMLMPGCYDHGREWVKVFTDVGAVLTGREPRTPLAPWITNADLDWYDALGALPAIVMRAAAPATPADHRAALLDALEVIAASGLADGDGRTRRLVLTSDTGRAELTPGLPVVTGEGRILVPFQVDPDQGGVTAIEHAADGRFGPVPGHTITVDRPFDRRGLEAGALARFAAAGRAHDGPASLLRPETVRALSAAGGISLAEATVLLAGTNSHQQWTERRPDDWRPAGDDVTDTAIEIAHEHLWRRDRGAMAAWAAVLLPAEPAGLWTGGPDTARFAAWRAATVGARTPVSDELIVECHRAGIAEGLSASEFLHGVANADTCRWLLGDARPVEGGHLLISLARGVPWLGRHLPAGDPIRAGLARALELMRRRATDPAFEVAVGGSDEAGVEKAAAALGLTIQRSETALDAGLFAAGATGYWRQVRLRPARLDGLADPRADALLAAVGGTSAALVALRAVAGSDLDAWLEAPPEAPHDPSRSAPELVEQVARRHGIGADAATLYLQLLALPDPTDRNVAAWTGWKPARLKAARAELASGELVVEAKRPRAGRSLFLPGGWLAWRAPLPPLERWKLPLLIGATDQGTRLGALVPLAPAPKLFHLAWARVVDGDHPRFEELTTRGRR